MSKLIIELIRIVLLLVIAVMYANCTKQEKQGLSKQEEATEKQLINNTYNISSTKETKTNKNIRRDVTSLTDSNNNYDKELFNKLKEEFGYTDLSNNEFKKKYATLEKIYILRKYEECNMNMENFSTEYPHLLKEYPVSFFESHRKYQNKRRKNLIELYSKLESLGFNVEKLKKDFPEYQNRILPFDYLEDLDGDSDIEFISLVILSDHITVAITNITGLKVKSFQEDIRYFGQHATVKLEFLNKKAKEGKYIRVINQRPIYKRSKNDIRQLARYKYESIILDFDSKEIERVVEIHECKEDCHDCPVFRRTFLE